MPEFEGEIHRNRFDIIARCNNPASSRNIVGITFFREGDQLETEAAANSIQNAQDKLKYCPPGCLYPCVLVNLAQSTPETVLTLINSNPSHLTDASQ